MLTYARQSAATLDRPESVLLTNPPRRDVGCRPDQRRFLLVTAPFGPFSKQLAEQLRARGARCTRVIANGGDFGDWGLAHSVVYRGEESGWAPWIRRYLQHERITDIVVHGDGYPHAAAAVGQARELGLRIHVFEEGYFRPHWITLERDGVNAASTLPRDPCFYRGKARIAPKTPGEPVGPITPAGVRRLIAFHLWAYFAQPFFPAFKLPYRYSLPQQSLGHIRRFLIQSVTRRRRERELGALIEVPGPMFVALLQRPGDAQLTRDPNFAEVSSFIEHVVASFAAHAPKDARLVFKAHPLDHGLERHDRVAGRAAARAGVGGRVFFIDSGHFPTLVRASRGVISVNSTGGLAALELGCPAIALGRAIYGLPGLTHQGGLDRFWAAPEGPDQALLADYRAVVMARTQINGDFSTARGISMVVPEAARRMLAV